jgi:alkanesulfonate monooxygenase SsuD/methylene tetrahydromethanopterin reductase-like flavin-dependent oxidoreductase (luciferase family)
LTVGKDLNVIISDPLPIHVWSLLAFANPVTLDETSTFAITADSVRNAQEAGFRPDQIVQFLERQASTPIDPTLAGQIRALAERVERFELSAALVIECDSAEQMETARALLEADGYRVALAGNRQIVTIGSQRTVAADIERVHARLDAAGLGPIVRRIRT